MFAFGTKQTSERYRQKFEQQHLSDDLVKL
jgi:hypothetical protein